MTRATLFSCGVNFSKLTEHAFFCILNKITHIDQITRAFSIFDYFPLVFYRFWGFQLTFHLFTY